jgi:hypothetical protein
VAQQVRFRLDDAAVDAVRALRVRAGSEPGTPAVAVAAAASVPSPAREALAAEVALLALPSLWLATLGTVAGRPDELVLAAVVDAELLAVHAAVHDALAGRVRGPVAAYLPGAWLPHCVLATGRLAEAFAALHPVEPVRARVLAVEVTGPAARR